ncbi:DUF6384 family protein [Pseudomonas sp. GM18]|uniref:DUF6384 family protein n=1 Tax=Pseudomonas sp. GM18 TaxID=1144324 RepID=UPI001EE68D2B|nr:DUF6384 family protein [Pseudomonas sp. GM18]
MAFVDELRHEQKQVQEHLDLPRRRADIAERIRVYYQSHDITFDDDLIEQGVRQFFAHRLKFEAPTLSDFNAWLVNTLINRGWGTQSAEPWFSGRRIFLLAVVLGLSLAFAPLVKFASYQVKVPEINREAYRLSQLGSDVNRELEVQRKKLETLQQSNAELQDANVSRLLKRVQQALPAEIELSDIGTSEPINRDNVDAIEQRVIALRNAQDAFWHALPQVKEDLRFAGGIIWMRQGIKETQQDPNRAAAIAQSADLYQRLALLEQQLARIDNDTGYQDAFFAYRDLNNDLLDTSVLTLQTRRHNELKSRLDSRTIPSDLRDELEGISHEIDADLKKGDSGAAEAKINHLVQKMKAAGYMLWIGRTDAHQRVTSNFDMILNG